MEDSLQCLLKGQLIDLEYLNSGNGKDVEVGGKGVSLLFYSLKKKMSKKPRGSRGEFESLVGKVRMLKWYQLSRPAAARGRAGWMKRDKSGA